MLLRYVMEPDSVMSSRRTRDNGHKLYYNLYIHLEDNLFDGRWNMGDRGIFILGAIQNLTEHSSEQPAVADPALRRGIGLDGLQRCTFQP